LTSTREPTTGDLRLGRGKYVIITLRGFDQHHVLLGTTKAVIFTVH
jgi:hypothetical protein